MKLDPGNKVALYRRARVVSLPVNASVEDIKLALEDLNAIGSQKPKILKEIDRLEKMAKINRKRERETYSKMFFANKQQQGQGGSKN